MNFLAKLAKFWILLAFAGFTGYLWIHNQDRIPLHIPPWVQHIPVPAWLAYSVFFLAGSFVTTVALILDLLGKALEIRRLRKALKEAQKSSAPWLDGGAADDGSRSRLRTSSALSSTSGTGISSLS
jgi:uncharacterized integral membrane protein